MSWWQRKKSVKDKLVGLPLQTTAEVWEKTNDGSGRFTVHQVMRESRLISGRITDDDVMYDIDEVPGSSLLEVEEIRDRILDLLTKGREVRQREVPYLIGWQQGGTQVNEVIDQLVSERLVAIRLSKKRKRMLSLRKKRY